MNSKLRIPLCWKVENRYAGHDGLNLSWEALEGILKHNGPLTDPAAADIPASADLMPATFASLEAQAAAIADDIAYNAHDIDDALRAGLLNLVDLRDVPLAGLIVREVLTRWPDIEPRRQGHEVQRRLITRAIEDVITTSSSEIAALAPKSSDDVRTAGHALIHFSPALAEEERGLKSFLYDRVYRSELVMGPVRRSEALVGALFDRLLQTADMPGRWGEAARAAKDENARARIVADYIAGMTDPFAEAEYARLFDGKRPLG